MLISNLLHSKGIEISDIADKQVKCVFGDNSEIILLIAS